MSVGIHGGPDGVEPYPNNPRGAKWLADRIRGHKKWREGMTVRLYSCNTGVGSINIAQSLADILNTTVIAPNEFMYFWNDGNWLIAPDDLGLDNARVQWDKGGIGNWKKFTKRFK